LLALEHDLATPPLVHGVAMLEVQRAMERGDLDALERHADRLLQIGLTGFSTSLATYGGALFELRWAQGRLGEAAETFVAAIDDMPSYAGYRPALVTVYYETGQLDAARDVFSVDAESDFDTFPYDQVWLSCMALYGEAAIALHDRHAATVLYERLSPFADLFAASGPIYYGITHRPLGRLAHFLGHDQDAERHLRVALNVNRQRDARYWLARTALDLAEMLADRHDAAAEITALTDEALGLARTGGYAAQVQRAHALRQ